MPDAPSHPAPATRTSLGELARLFLKLGTIAFGGPAAHIAMMEDEVVRRRGWLTRERFLDYVGMTNLIPGPNSTELAIHIGMERAGWPGLLVAGSCFILPAAAIVCVIAWAYVRFGALPAAAALLYGVKPVVIAVVLQALSGLARTALKSVTLLMLGIACLAAAGLEVNELAILALAAIVMVVARRFTRGDASNTAAIMLAGAVPQLRDQPPGRDLVTAGSLHAGAGAAAGISAFGLWPMFAVFLKIGSVLFGSGYVLLAFLRADLVHRLGWLTERQLLDAVAVGQITPGPVFTTATFIGYVLGGASGAAVATIGIFLPAFVFVALSAALLPKIRASLVLRAALDGVNVASLALMAMVTVQLGRAAVVDWITVGIVLGSLLLLVHYRVNSAWLVIAGGAIGMIVMR
ncbi:MAG: chromate efflux transporter [bacterium]